MVTEWNKTTRDGRWEMTKKMLALMNNEHEPCMTKNDGKYGNEFSETLIKLKLSGTKELVLAFPYST
jgi:hypothetical protein